jgi:hypothetical protein
MPHTIAGHLLSRPRAAGRSSAVPLAVLFTVLTSLQPPARAQPAAAGAPAIPSHMRCEGAGAPQAGSARTAPERSRIAGPTFLQPWLRHRAEFVRRLVMNGVVRTTPRDTRGFAAVAQGFDSIREGHRELRIEGCGLEDLRTVVDSRAVFEHPGHTGC